MNKIHRIIWSAVRGAFVVAHEMAASHGKPSSVSSSSPFKGEAKRGMGAGVEFARHSNYR